MCEIKVMSNTSGTRLYCGSCDEGIVYLLHGNTLEYTLEKVQAHLRRRGPVHEHEWEYKASIDTATGMARVFECCGDCGMTVVAR